MDIENNQNEQFTPHIRHGYEEIIKTEGNQKEFDYYGVHCYLRRNTLGNWCGYVRARDLVLDNYTDKQIEENLEDDWGVQLHGGITYVGIVDDTNEKFIGFDSSHVGDLSILVLTPFDEEPLDKNDSYFTLKQAISSLENFIERANELNKIHQHHGTLTLHF